MSDLDPWSRDRWWNTALQQWVYPHDINDALDAAALAIDEYYNGDRTWAEEWLLRAYEANQKEKAK